MKRKLLLVAVLSAMLLAACTSLEYQVGHMKEALKGREAVIQTYDENSQLVDRIVGKSISLTPENAFATKDSEGVTTDKSSVLSITVGGKSMMHVGSSLIMSEVGLVNIFDEYSKTVDIENFDRSIPFLNSMVNEMQNYTTGKSKIILIRSQSGKPLATYAGDKVSYFATDIDKATGLLIDGKYLFIYRSDYTIYETDLLR